MWHLNTEEYSDNHDKSKEISSEVKKVIIQQWISDKSYRKLSVNFKIAHTIMASIVGKYKRLGTVENLARSDRLRKITSKYERKILWMVQKNSSDNSQRVTSRFVRIKDKRYTTDHKYNISQESVTISDS